MNKIKTLFTILIAIISLNFIFPSELNPMFQLASIYAIFLIYLSANIEVVYLNKRFNIDKMNMAITFLVLAIFTVTTISGVYFSRSRDYLLLALGYIMLILFIRSVTLSEKIIWTGLNLLTLAAVVVSLYAIAQYYTNFFDLASRMSYMTQMDDNVKQAIMLRLAQKRVFAFFPFPTTLSAFLAIIIPINIGQYVYYKNRTVRSLVVFLLFLNITALILTKSYGGIATLFAVILIVGIIRIFKSKKDLKKSLAVTVGMFIVLVVIGIVFSLFRGGLFNMEDPTNPISLRLSNWNAALKIIADYPLLGVGPGNYATVYPRYYMPGTQPSQFAHNTYLQLASEIGIYFSLILLTLFTAWIIKIVSFYFIKEKKKVNEPKILYLTLLASSAAFLVNNVFEINTYYPSLGFLGIFILSLLHKTTCQGVMSSEGRIFMKNKNGRKTTLREKEAVLILVIAWLIVTAVIMQRFTGLILYDSASDSYKQNRPVVAENDLRIAKFVDPFDSRYFRLDGLIKLNKQPAIDAEKNINNALRSSARSITLNPRTPSLRSSYSSFLFRIGSYWESLYQLYYADHLMPHVEKYRDSLELLKKTLSGKNEEDNEKKD